MYKVRYPFENMDKFINDKQFDELDPKEQYFYTKVIPKKGTSLGYINEEALAYEEAGENLKHVVNQFWD